MIIVETRIYDLEETFPQINVDGLYRVENEEDALKLVKRQIERMIKGFPAQEYEVTRQSFPDDTDFDFIFTSGTPVIYKMESEYADEPTEFIAFQLKP